MVYVFKYILIYVICEEQLSIVNMKCELVDPDGLLHHLRILKSINVDGVMVDCWWGIVEAHTPHVYDWSGYKRLFQIVHDMQLKLQVNKIPSIMSFLFQHSISLPNYVSLLSTCINSTK